MLNIAKSVSIRLEEGNDKSAVRLLLSDDVEAKSSVETRRSLQEKHPAAPLDRRPPENIEQPVLSATFCETEVRKAIFKFPAGSAAGHDGLSPQHLKDIISSETGIGPTLKSLTTLINLIIDGGVPDEIRPIFFGAR